MRARAAPAKVVAGADSRSEESPAALEGASKQRGLVRREEESASPARERRAPASRLGGAPAGSEDGAPVPERGATFFELVGVPAHREAGGAALSRVAAPVIQRAAASDEAPVVALIVDDDAALGPGQRRKAELLAEIGRASCDEADRALREVGRDTNGCPQVQRWLSYYADRPAAHLERAIRRYAPETRGATDARSYVGPVAQRIGRGAERWARTGRLPADIPDEIRAAALGGTVGAVAEALGNAVGGLFSSVGRALGGLFRKGQDDVGAGGRAVSGRSVDPGIVCARLGAGRPLDGPMRARMETAFAYDFSRVRVHTGAPAAELADGLNARAFTLGSDVAFADDQYRLGTVAGDALLAHELAHVVQQGGVSATGAAAAQPATLEPAAETALEAEADAAAADAVVLIHGGRAQKRPRPRRALERLAAPLRLQRCGGGGSSRDPRAGTSLPTASEQREVRAALHLPLAAERSASAAPPAAGGQSAALDEATTEWAGAKHPGDTPEQLAQADTCRAEIKTRLTQGIQTRFNALLPQAQTVQGQAAGVTINRFEGAANAAVRVVRQKFGAWMAADATVGATAPTHSDFQFHAGTNLQSSFDRPAREAAGTFASPQERVARLATYSAEHSPAAISAVSGAPYFFNLERGDSANPETETGFFRAEIVAPFVAAHASDLDLITQFLIATTDRSTGTVFLPTDVPGGAGSAGEPPNRNELIVRWSHFMTTVHEFLHMVTHPTFTRALGVSRTANEGFTEMFTAEVLQGLPVEDATRDDRLRHEVEGDDSRRASFNLLPYQTVPSYQSYRAAAEAARAALARRQGDPGAENAVRAAE